MWNTEVTKSVVLEFVPRMYICCMYMCFLIVNMIISMHGCTTAYIIMYIANIQYINYTYIHDNTTTYPSDIPVVFWVNLFDPYVFCCVMNFNIIIDTTMYVCMLLAMYVAIVFKCLYTVCILY